MPKVFSADWNKVRIRCVVIHCPSRDVVSVQVESDEPVFDEELFHWDPVGPTVLSLLGRTLMIQASRLPADLRVPNSVFWLDISNEKSFRLFRNEHDEEPLHVNPEASWMD